MEMKDVEEYSIDDNEGEEYNEEKTKRPLIRTPVDLQRLKVEKLMKNPDKQIIIPETPKEKDFMLSVPTFVRNVMGSSAGAGSGEFHVYRHLRRKEYARQKYIQAKSIREQLDDDYHNKLEKNKLDSEAKTAKKRAKRLKRKQNIKGKGKKPRIENENSCSAPNENDTTDSENDISEISASNDVQRDQEDEGVEPKKSCVENELSDISSGVANKQLVDSEIIVGTKDESKECSSSDSLKDTKDESKECSPSDSLKDTKNESKECCSSDPDGAAQSVDSSPRVSNEEDCNKKLEIDKLC